MGRTEFGSKRYFDSVHGRDATIDRRPPPERHGTQPRTQLAMRAAAIREARKLLTGSAKAPVDGLCAFDPVALGDVDVGFNKVVLGFLREANLKRHASPCTPRSGRQPARRPRRRGLGDENWPGISGCARRSQGRSTRTLRRGTRPDSRRLPAVWRGDGGPFASPIAGDSRRRRGGCCKAAAAGRMRS
jgi:hypothetical protein